MNGQSSISRQEFFALFARAMQLTDKSEEYKSVDLKQFADAKDIANWAEDYIRYLVYNKEVDGKEENGVKIINPKGDILRNEIIKMVTAALTAE